MPKGQGWYRALTAWLAAIMIVALGQFLASANLSAEEASPLSASPPTQGKTTDELYALVANEVPQFGGVFSDGPDSIQLLIQGGSASDATSAQASLAKYLSPIYATKKISVLPATYSFVQLKEWRDLLRTEIFAVEGVTLNSFDMRANGLRIGVSDPAVYESGSTCQGAGVRHSSGSCDCCEKRALLAS